MQTLPDPFRPIRSRAAGLLVATLVLIGLAASPAQAQDFPSRPIRVIVPYSAGTSPDIVARIMGEEMAKVLGQPLVVENKPGADGIIGSEYVARQMPADGYTLLSGIVSNFAILPLTVKNLRFDPLKDLPAVIGLVEGRYVFLSSATQPWKNFDEMVAYARANPGRLNYGSPTPQVRLSTDELLRGLNLNVTHIPYTSGGPYATALLAGEVQMGFISTSSAISFGPRARVLAVTGAKRRAPFLDVPTLKELGRPDLPGLNFTFNVASGTPSAIVDKLHAAAARVLQMPSVQKRFDEQGFDIVAEGPEASARRLASQAALFTEIAQKVGIKPQ